MDKTTNKGPVTFAAIDPWLQQNIVLPTETKGAKFVQWGTNNRYPDYLLDLYRNVPTLRSIISGSADFVAGDDVTSRVPLNGEAPAREVVHDTAVQDFIFGGFAFQVIRDREGRPVRAIPTQGRARRAGVPQVHPESGLGEDGRGGTRTARELHPLREGRKVAGVPGPALLRGGQGLRT